MKNRDKTFLQKIKDNAFYVALGLGLIAILAVVAVYTMEQGANQVTQNEVDLNQASDYLEIATEEEVAELDDEIQVAENPVDEENWAEMQTLERTEEMTEAGAVNETEVAETEDAEAADIQETDVAAESDNIPVTGNVGELNFTSDKTLAWPVQGEVILPYSMETTVYFKTLEQYQCNPGMLISAGNGTTVQNAFLGKVTNVTSDNTYGNLVTLYIGNDYSIVYGQLDTVYVKEGDYVKAGESIGTVGNPTDSFTEEGSHLFFRMNKGEEAVDPMSFME